MDGNYSAGEVGGIFAGITTAVAGIWAAAKWLLGWRDGKLKAWEESLDRREKALRLKTEARLVAVETEVGVLRTAFFDTRGILFEVTVEMRLQTPHSPVLARAEAQLGKRYPGLHDSYATPMGPLPDDMADHVRRLDDPA